MPTLPRASRSFSVIVPTYNRADQLDELLAALAEQRWYAFEIVVVDDGSTDDTRTLLRDRECDGVRWATQANSGPWAARNLGASLARGEWLVFLDDDDRVADGWLQDFAALITPEVGVVSCG